MNQNFTVALMDKNYNMFKTSPTGLTSKIFTIPEHDKRIDELSMECHFFIDEELYKALGYRGVPFKYTKVFVKDVSKYSTQKYCKFAPLDSFYDHVRKYNKFDENRPLFISGGTEFLKMSMRVSSKLLLTVVDDTTTPGYEKFPIKTAMETYKGSKKIEPTMIKEIKAYKKALKAKQEREFIVTEGGAKIFKEPEAPKYDENTLNLPNYMFYEYRK